MGSGAAADGATGRPGVEQADNMAATTAPQTQAARIARYSFGFTNSKLWASKRAEA